MLQRTLMLLIKNGRTEGLKEKIDILYALGRLSEMEFKELYDALASNVIK